jgi:hypothetical protein
MFTSSDTTAREAPLVRRRRLGNPGRLKGLTPLPHRPLSPRDRQAWRARRETEMKIWMGADKATTVSKGMQDKPSLDRFYQTKPASARKRESTLFAILTTAVFGAIGALLNESPETIRLWVDFFRALSGL